MIQVTNENCSQANFEMVEYLRMWPTQNLYKLTLVANMALAQEWTQI